MLYLNLPRLRPPVLLKRVLRLSMERRWNDTDRGKRKYPGNNQSQSNFNHHKSHVDWLGTELWSPH